MKKLVYVSTIVLITLLLVGCVGGPSWQGNIMGQVFFYGSRKPVNGAIVSVGTKTDRTDASGNFVIRGIPSGKHL